jgi:hypothetical protein
MKLNMQQALYFAVCFKDFLPQTGHALAQSVEALHYKPERRGFDSGWESLQFVVDVIHPAALWPWG